jgi:hypothetical protein
MSTNIARGERFSAQLTAFRNKANRDIDTVRRGVALRLFKAVILDTPVDTGRLRGNWQCTINVPARSSSISEDKSGGGAINSAASVIKQSTISDALILTNSLPYVARIEYDGWSHTKAPRGMVRINVARFKQILGEEVKVTLSRG